MPAGDAGLERQTLDTAAIRRRVREAGDLTTEYGRVIHVVDGEEPLADAVLDLAKSVPRLLDEIDRLQAQVVTLIAWIRARQHIESDSLTDEQILSAVNGWAELEAQAAQPEGEQAR